MENQKKEKSILKPIIGGIVAVIALIILFSSISYNTPENSVLVFQFGQVVKVKEDTGLYFKVPIIQTSKDIYVGERLYDVSESEVITSDKKTMIANCYVTWQIVDTKLYYQTLSSESVAQSRIDVAVYNAMKNVISATSQEDVISGKDGSLGSSILKKVTSLSQYGIEITQIEMKLLDLPTDNKEAVYNRMISERAVIAAEYEANGQKEATAIRSQTDKEVREIISDAEVVAADTKAEGESEYFRILSEAYSSSAEREEFYNYIVGLETLKTSLAEGGTITITSDSPLYDILINNK